MDRNMPSNGFPEKAICHNTQIVVFPASFKEGNAVVPYEIGSFLFKILLRMVA
jgi:hypothetical protein